MVTAIIAAVIAVLVAAVIICVIFALRAKRDRSMVSRHGKRISSIDTVGVESNVRNAAGGDAHMGDGMSAAGNSSLDERFLVARVFAGVVLGLLAVKTFTLQVLSGSSFKKASESNQYAYISSPAPRGTICDCAGRELVRNRSCLTIVADSEVSDDFDVLARLSAVLGIPRNVLRQRVLDSSSGAQAKRVILSDASIRNVAFISEHSDAFAGVSIETRVVRDYPYKGLAAHVLGYTGTASQDEIDAAGENRTIMSGDDVGKSGIESYYDNLLAGEHGSEKVVTDASGNIIEVVSNRAATKGSDVVLTIDAQVQYMADYELANLIAPEDNAIGSGTGTSGAIVVMDVRDGAIIAMASYPTYDPCEFVGGISDKMWEIYSSETNLNPLLNRCIQGTYPAASTFKAFTGLAGLRYGYATEDTTWVCTGEWDGWDSGDVQKCWYKYGHGTLDLYEGIVQSCDVVYYEMAKQFFDNRKTIGYTAMQDEVMKYRFGSASGIDIDGEAYGRVPTPEWKAEYFKDVPEESTWKGGDLTNMSIGQGYVLITPLQLAVAYGGIATGKIYQPHLLREVRNAEGQTVATFQPTVVTTPDVDAKHLAYIREALHGVATEGSVAQYFSELGIDAAAKTGTGEVVTKGDYAWSVCYAPYDDPHYVAVVLIEEGGGGGSVAMPICSQMLAAALEAEEGTLSCGVGVVQGSTGAVKEYSFTSSGRED